jgi:hypothetical protein
MCFLLACSANVGRDEAPWPRDKCVPDREIPKQSAHDCALSIVRCGSLSRELSLGSMHDAGYQALEIIGETAFMACLFM